MSIIIRPSPEVFRRTMPLTLVFGACRIPGRDPLLDRADTETIVDTVRWARRLSIPLAFLRLTGDEDSNSGTWLPGCRPRVCDRVFEHARGSALANDIFVAVFMNLHHGEFFAVGPRNDSSMRATVSAADALDRPIQVIMPTHPLQNCSTTGAGFPRLVRSSPYSDHHRELSFDSWEKTMCLIE
ncbi:MAG: hypothetical protein AAGE76_05360 [Pseudomonadota bacterium]